jgi:hypothetical protein
VDKTEWEGFGPTSTPTPTPPLRGWKGGAEMGGGGDGGGGGSSRNPSSVRPKNYFICYFSFKQNFIPLTIIRQFILGI